MYTILPPQYRAGGVDSTLAAVSGLVYADGQFQVTVTTEELQTGCVRLTHSWKNRGSGEIRFQPEISVEAGFACEHYVIPGVSYNGNAWGKGLEPKGLELDGQPWVFDYHRTTIPGCTVSEGEGRFLALFASDEGPASLTCSCSMALETGGRMIHRLLYPIIERPMTYSDRDRYTEPYESYIRLEPGETFTATAYLLTGEPPAPNYAMAAVEDMALELLGSEFPPAYAMEQLPPLCKSHALHLLKEVHGRQMFCIGFSPEHGAQQKRDGAAFGWCGQNGMLARLFIQEGLKTGYRELLEIGLSNLDGWVLDAGTHTGLLITQYEQAWEDGPAIVDTCNQGFAIVELLKAYRILKAAGIDRDTYRQAALRVADFFLQHYSAVNGFGKAWNARTGVCTDPNGTIGAYIIPGLVDAYRETGKEEYLERAKEAYRLYGGRDLAQFACTAGALDTYCIDKETSGPMLIGALLLYEVDPCGEWLDWAKKSAWYFCSWMMHYDALYTQDTDFTIAGYRTLGGTTVSAQHHHIDPWGALIVPSLVKLYEITGDRHWQKRARLIWANAVQNIAPAEGKMFHGMWRHPGAQNEGYCHCRWGEDHTGGQINDWLVAWPQAYCWNTAVTITDSQLEEV